MKKRFNWKQFIGKRVLSLLMIFVMFMGVVPESVAKGVVDGISNVVTAFAAEQDVWYWGSDKSTLYIKDGQSINLYAALTDSSGLGLTPKAKTDGRWGIGNYDAAMRYAEQSATTTTDSGWEAYGNNVTNGASISLDNDGTYKAAATTGSSYSVTGLGKWNNVKNFTVVHYYDIQAGAGVTLTTTDINGTSVSVADGATVSIKAGTSIKMSATPAPDGKYVQFKDTATDKTIADWNTYKPSKSTTVTVEYIDEGPSKVTYVNFDNDRGFDSVVALDNTPVNGTNTFPKDDYTLTVTPKDSENGVYVDSVEVVRKTGEATYENVTMSNSKWNGVTFSASLTIDHDEEYTVKVTYGKVTLENQGGVLLLNGYGDKKFEDLKGNILRTVLGGSQVGANTDYTVYVWLDPIGDARYFNLDDKGTLGDWNQLTVAYKDRFTVPAYGTTGQLKVKIVKKATDKTAELTLADVIVTTKESRQPATVSLGSFTAAQDTYVEFENAVKNAITVTNSANANITANAGLNVTLNPVEGKTNTYTISYTTNEGETWLATSGTLPSEVVWSANTYTVTFLDWDGTVLKSETLNGGAEIKAPTPAREGYNFTGWDKAVPANVSKDTGNLVFTAQYAINQYTVTFVDWNGDVLNTQTANFGTAITKPADPTREGYTFKGWDKEIPATMPAGNLTITATYTINQYTVTWVIDGVSTPETVDFGTEIGEPTAPSKDGYNFECWNDEAGKCVTFPITVKGNITLTASFTQLGTVRKVRRHYAHRGQAGQDRC